LFDLGQATVETAPKALLPATTAWARWGGAWRSRACLIPGQHGRETCGGDCCTKRRSSTRNRSDSYLVVRQVEVQRGTCVSRLDSLGDL